MNIIIQDNTTYNTKLLYGNNIAYIEVGDDFIKFYFNNYLAPIKFKGYEDVVAAAARVIQQELLHGTTTVDLSTYELYESKKEAN